MEERSINQRESEERKEERDRRAQNRIRNRAGDHMKLLLFSLSVSLTLFHVAWLRRPHVGLVHPCPLGAIYHSLFSFFLFVYCSLL